MRPGPTVVLSAALPVLAIAVTGASPASAAPAERAAVMLRAPADGVATGLSASVREIRGGRLYVTVVHTVGPTDGRPGPYTLRVSTCADATAARLREPCPGGEARRLRGQGIATYERFRLPGAGAARAVQIVVSSPEDVGRPITASTPAAMLLPATAWTRGQAGTFFGARTAATLQIGVRSVRFEAVGATRASVRWSARGAAAVGTHWHVGAQQDRRASGPYEPPHDLAFLPDRRLTGRSQATIATPSPALKLHGWADPAPPGTNYRTLFTGDLPRPAGG